MPSSRIPGFHALPRDERLARVAAFAGLSKEEQAALSGAMGLDAARADGMVENVVGTFALPLAFATNFVVNGRDVLVPMAIEESSVVAAASFGAKCARERGGFRARFTGPPLATAQIQLVDVPDLNAARRALADWQGDLIRAANDAQPSLVARGGGARWIEWRTVTTERNERFLVVHLHVDVQDAMGANLVNTMAEAIAPAVAEITGGRALLRILTNWQDKRVVRAEATFPGEAVGGAQVVADVVRAFDFADADPYRAATHNKGILNGVDAVVLATGNDWRAVEAGAHAHAARTGRYRSLSKYWITPEGDLGASLELPLALGIVGGATKVHPAAQAALKVIGAKTGPELSEIAASVGLAQNFAALRALATEGIQRGHMRLHARNLAITAGVPAARADEVVAAMLAEGGQPSVARAATVWRTLQSSSG